MEAETAEKDAAAPSRTSAENVAPRLAAPRRSCVRIFVADEAITTPHSGDVETTAIT
jgi:hypothetical protein